MSTAKELRNLAKELGLRGYTTAKKADLIEMIEQHHRLQASKEAAPAEQVPGHFEPPKETVKQVEAAASGETLTPKGYKSRGPNSWSKFLADYSKEHGCSLKVAMTKKDEYASYKAKLAAK